MAEIEIREIQPIIRSWMQIQPAFGVDACSL